MLKNFYSVTPTQCYDKLYPYYVDMYQSLDQDLCSLKQTLKTL